MRDGQRIREDRATYSVFDDEKFRKNEKAFYGMEWILPLLI